MNNQKEFVLILPDDVVEMSVGAVKLCELFVFKVLNSPEDEIVLSVDEKSREIRSNSVEIEELISMYLGSKRVHEFYCQLAGLAYKHDRAGSFSLKVLVNGEAIQITINELSGLPYLHLKVTKSSAPLIP